MKVAGAVVAHALEVEILQKIERLQHHRSLRPTRELVYRDPLVAGGYRFLDLYLPAGEIGDGVQSALFARAATEFLGDVAFIKTLISGVDRLLAVLAGFQRLRLGIHEFLQSGEQVRLAPNLTGTRRFVRLARVREEQLL